MHSLGHQTLEATGALATPASLLPRLVLELEQLIERAQAVGAFDVHIETHSARQVLEAAKAALPLCNGCDQHVPVLVPASRTLPPHRDKRDRLCSYAGATITREQLAATEGHRLPALV